MCGQSEIDSCQRDIFVSDDDQNVFSGLLNK